MAYTYCRLLYRSKGIKGAAGLYTEYAGLWSRDPVTTQSLRTLSVPKLRDASSPSTTRLCEWPLEVSANRKRKLEFHDRAKFSEKSSKACAKEVIRATAELARLVGSTSLKK
jgi:hypothetical protein